MIDFRRFDVKNLPFVNRVNWLIVFGLLPLVVGILITFVIMIVHEI